LHEDWERYDTRHAVFRPAQLSPEALEAGYWRAYKEFYSFRNIAAGALAKDSLAQTARHLALAVGWKKLAPVWDLVLRVKQINKARAVLETVLDGLGHPRGQYSAAPEVPAVKPETWLEL
ncbi:MAG: B12-binding domain-containing radical SAM protein, partial [FCB group bacterium]|nr:B12-binding domain-containing radical SAM protein [FCB group bacterium]